MVKYLCLLLPSTGNRQLQVNRITHEVIHNNRLKDENRFEDITIEGVGVDTFVV